MRLCGLISGLLGLLSCGPPEMERGVDGVLYPENFELELVRRAGPEEGSWISMAFSDDGTLFLSPESGRILRMDPDGVGLLPIAFPIGNSQGMCWANNSLYVNVAGDASLKGGLHQLFDHDGNGVFDEHRRLVSFGPASEHAAHAIVLGPDHFLYTVWGNHVEIPVDLAGPDSSFRNFSEDVLLPRVADPRGHANGITMPAGTLWRFGATGESWELLAGGMRNVFDIAFTENGDLFGYDADMEWDIGTPWYRPPRLLHLVPGGDYGWRSGSAKLDPACPDTLPAVVDTDFSSPTGILSTHQLRGSRAYNADLLMADWAYGRLLAVKLDADGASFSGEVRVFSEGRPWNIVDLAAGPDGALWILTGGRGTASSLYRMFPRNQASDFPKAPSSIADPWKKGLTTDSSSLWQNLGSKDRWVRWQARLALEKAEDATWVSWALEKGVAPPSVFRARAEGRLALARTRPGMAVEIWDRLLAEDWWLQETVQRLDLRTAQILLARYDLVLEKSDRVLFLDRLLNDLSRLEGSSLRLALELLVALDAPQLPTRLLVLMQSGNTTEMQLHAALILRLVQRDWDAKTQRLALAWARRARWIPGGASLEGFVNAITLGLRDMSGPELWDDLVDDFPPTPSKEAEALALQESFAPRKFVRDWSVASALVAIEPHEATASAQRGFQILNEAQCLACHRFSANGHGLGPDLTGVGRRFDRKMLLESILDPANVISDQYKTVAMPDGLMDTFSASEIADLLLFLELGGR